MNRFHLSLVVPDLAATVAFHRDVLGCAVERDAGRWVDIGFFGHQLTLHQADGMRAARPLDHFGVVLDRARWTSLRERLDACGYPHTRVPQPDADAGGKFVCTDPAGNVLEFKVDAREA